MADDRFEPGSFRDRSARVFYQDGVVLRGLDTRALADWQALAATRFFRRHLDTGTLVPTEQLAPAEVPAGAGSAGWAAVLRHAAIPVVSYPYEWCFGMLRDAALLQLDLLRDALKEGMILKDASPFNVQWRGASPVFIDIASFERLRPGEPWAGYRQFCQLCLYPLLLQAYKDVAFHPWLRGSLEGIDPEDCRRLMSARDYLRPGVLAHVYLQARAQARYGGSRRDVRGELRQAGFDARLIAANVRGLRRLIEGLAWTRARSTWSHYDEEHTYDREDAGRKRQFVARAAADRPRRLVWDLGCNTGIFSRLAAEQAEYVVALDADHLAVERLYARLKAEGSRTVLPLVADLANPSPGLGWRNRERTPFAERSRPDLILALALIHHAVIASHVPLPEFVDWLAEPGADLVIEFVGREDPMVQALLRNKDEVYADYDRPVFERVLAERFHLERQETLASGTRTLYFARPRRAG